MQKKSTSDALNFIRSRDGELESLMLAACLTALGIPFSERPAFAVSGDSEPVVNWLFDESSLDGKFKASEMIARWQDNGWITRTDNDRTKPRRNAEEIADLAVQILDIIAIALLAEAAKAVEILTDLRCRYLHHL